MLHRLLRWLVCLLLPCLLAACASRPSTDVVALPVLRLAPAALGKSLAVQQQLRFHKDGQERVMEALLEVDADAVRLAVQAMGQTGVRLHWDGQHLEQQRAAWLPASVRGERVLDDLQFALWPADAIRAVLPAGWVLQEDATTRRLQYAGKTWWSVTRVDAAHMHLDNLAAGYQLDILTSQDAADSPDTSPP